MLKRRLHMLRKAVACGGGAYSRNESKLKLSEIYHVLLTVGVCLDLTSTH